ncbi:hypothetical protein SAMN05421688_2206 [Poseidonocella pacifica]|uniref:MotA/TolQ/ExbB proton channel family protein n=1 Tax=Poseidonocella pacifica TaxID=871651 RepID=A0A1I0XF50_9RHOB|nr:biopolymer transporter ExbB [Poseidonocella pacifica]SFA99621.1 hypothetical protein SAMN05421688_2206 [Poseidonocella pacifica]
MTSLDRTTGPQFSQPVRQIVLMLAALGLSGAGAFLALPRVLPVFEANPWLNGFIVFVFVVGVLACFYQVLQMITSVRWIEGFAANIPGHEMTRPPSLLAPLASLLRSRGAHTHISASSARSILDSVATRLDEMREITRYIVNLLIFLGLLGTFYGLATTVPAVVDTIRSLAPQEGEAGIAVFNRLMTGLEAQLGGMGVAFASSLLGLAGSLVVGLLELFAGHGQNRFYREMEEWLSTITRLGYAGADGEDSGADQATVMLLDRMAEQMQAMQGLFVQSDARHAALEERIGQLAGALENGAGGETMERVATAQEALLEHVRGQEVGTVELDAESRMRLRSIDVQLLRLLEEMTAGRAESVDALRSIFADTPRGASLRRGPGPQGDG